MSESVHESAFGANLSPQSFARFSEFITRELGIKMPPAKMPLLQSRLLRRLRQLDLGSLDEYQRYLFDLPDSSAEWNEFIDQVTTNKTDFFREPGHFDYLTQAVLPALSRKSGAPWKLSLWSAGCSSGEEPYTLAMVLSEVASANPGFDFSIFATDISTRVLQQAQSAIYAEAKADPVPQALRHRYLLHGKDPERPEVRVVPELRQKVSFTRLNLMSADYGIRQQFEVVFFRNVMIYFSQATQQQVLLKVCRQLKPEGFLFVGHSESLMGIKLPVKQVSRAVFQKTA